MPKIKIPGWDFSPTPKPKAQDAPAFERWLEEVTPSFVWDAPHLRYIREQLQRVTSGEIDRLMLFVPPRHGKSEMATVRYPIWRMERDPELTVIVGAYNKMLADNFSRKARRIARERLQLDDERSAVDEWQTAQGGVFRAVGVGTGVTGKGAKLIILDDPVKSREEANSPAYRERVWNWYTDDLYTRLEPDGAIILIMTRWHDDDLAGRILASDDKDSWTVVTLPARAEAHDPLGRAPGAPLWPERFDVAGLDRIETVLGEQSFASLYQQRPTAEDGEIFRRSFWDLETGRNRYDINDVVIERKAVARWIFGDTALKDASSNDYSAFSVVELWPDYRIALRYVWMERIQSAFLPEKITELATRFNVDGKLHGCVIEDKGSGTTAIQTLRSTAPEWLANMIHEFTPHGTKQYRARQASVWCARDCVQFPYPDASAPWHFDTIDDESGQLYKFPAAAHDDFVDTLTMSVIYLENYLSAGFHARLGGTAHE
jgi:predicted phage terminase large subunit-like protein